MNFEIRKGVVRDATHDLTQAFQLSNFCRELAKAKIIPGSEHIIGLRSGRADDRVEERPGEYGAKKEPNP